MSDLKRPSLSPDLFAPPHLIEELAAACSRFVLEKYQVALDGTSDTLSVLDHYIEMARPNIHQRPEAFELLEGAIGAYFGEVTRTTFGGYWFAIGDTSGWRLDLSAVYLTFNPIGVAREALLCEHAAGWHADFNIEEKEKAKLIERLASLGEIEETEYYRLSNRFDVLQIIVDALHANRMEAGLGQTFLTPNDYKK
ncbi:hypothetical protein [Pajaroellobacter abortibovis]|uniref:Uncharacterized protein n=1 Tax=Pajaroellobacter abortibovis TaxID=1882918 RepID=A0A1L6MYT8_9BACT|nr:hypothetical protein [Pajaroellobacter abortibovis]APS00682.1 hypothetical protein BCY86_08335 [Pajaroellobacter abortibovis]